MGGQWLILFVAMPIVGGLIACSGLIAKKVPNSKELLNKLLPYKGAIGAAMLGCFIYNLIKMSFNPFSGFQISTLFGILVVGVMFSMLFLGFTMGFGLVAKWIPGDSAPEEKAEEIQRKLIPFEVPMGIIAIASGVMALMFRLKPEWFF